MTIKTFIVLIAICAAGANSSGAALSDSPASPEKNAFFKFHSGFWINLHHFLYLQAVLSAPDARKDAAVAVERAIPVPQMTAQQHLSWDKELAYYRQFGNSDALRDRTLVKANYELSDAGNNPSLADAHLLPEMRTALEQAAPVYRALWWNEQDQRNRQWIAVASGLVAEYGQSLAPRLASVYRKPWPTEKIPVEVVLYANWAGAYTTLNSTLITVSSLPTVNPEAAPLETLFHEASHALVGSVQDAISQQCEKEGMVLNPPTLWHALLFYTTGELVKELIPGYIPFAEANGLWKRAWPGYIRPLQQDWKPYLEGKATLASAIAALVKDTGQPRSSENGNR